MRPQPVPPARRQIDLQAFLASVFSASQPWHDVLAMLGVPVRMHDLTGNDLGTALLPPPVAVGDLMATEHGEYRVQTVVEVPPGSAIDGLVRVTPAYLRVVAA